MYCYFLCTYIFIYFIYLSILNCLLTYNKTISKSLNYLVFFFALAKKLTFGCKELALFSKVLSLYKVK